MPVGAWINNASDSIWVYPSNCGIVISKYFWRAMCLSCVVGLSAVWARCWGLYMMFLVFVCPGGGVVWCDWIVRQIGFMNADFRVFLF